MKKLVYIVHSIETGGVEVAFLSAIPKLIENFDLSIIVLGKIDKQLISHLTDDQKKVFIQFDYKIIYYAFVLPRIIFSILRLEPEIVLSSLWRGALVGSILKTLRPKTTFVGFIHSTYFFHRLDEIFSRKVIRQADFVLTDSQSTSNFVKKINEEVRVKIVSFLTISTPLYLDALFDNVEEEIRFISLGRLNSIKNIPFAVEAVSYLRKHNLNVYLDIYGRDNGAEDEIRNAILEHNMGFFVSLKGEILPNKRFELFNQYHGLMQFSSVEGMAMSVVEAMQHGLLCAVTPVGEIPNYSRDMFSAVFMSIENQEKRVESYEKLRQVLSDRELSKIIAINANCSFRGKKLYSESLVEELLNI